MSTSSAHDTSGRPPPAAGPSSAVRDNLVVFGTPDVALPQRVRSPEDLTMDPLEGRFVIEPVIGGKRLLNAQHAHTLENAKSPRYSKLMENPPALKLTQAYLEPNAKRQRWLSRGNPLGRPASTVPASGSRNPGSAAVARPSSALPTSRSSLNIRFPPLESIPPWPLAVQPLSQFQPPPAPLQPPPAQSPSFQQEDIDMQADQEGAVLRENEPLAQIVRTQEQEVWYRSAQEQAARNRAFQEQEARNALQEQDERTRAAQEQQQEYEARTRAAQEYEARTRAAQEQQQAHEARARAAHAQQQEQEERARAAHAQQQGQEERTRAAQEYEARTRAAQEQQQAHEARARAAHAQQQEQEERTRVAQEQAHMQTLRTQWEQAQREQRQREQLERARYEQHIRPAQEPGSQIPAAQTAAQWALPQSRPASQSSQRPLPPIPSLQGPGNGYTMSPPVVSPVAPPGVTSRPPSRLPAHTVPPRPPRPPSTMPPPPIPPRPSSAVPASPIPAGQSAQAPSPPTATHSGPGLARPPSRITSQPQSYRPPTRVSSTMPPPSTVPARAPIQPQVHAKVPPRPPQASRPPSSSGQAVAGQAFASVVPPEVRTMVKWVHRLQEGATVTPLTDEGAAQAWLSWDIGMRERVVNYYNAAVAELQARERASAAARQSGATESHGSSTSQNTLVQPQPSHAAPQGWYASAPGGWSEHRETPSQQPTPKPTHPRTATATPQGRSGRSSAATARTRSRRSSTATSRTHSQTSQADTMEITYDDQCLPFGTQQSFEDTGTPVDKGKGRAGQTPDEFPEGQPASYRSIPPYRPMPGIALNARPHETNGQPSTPAGGLGADIAVMLVGQLQDFSSAMQDHASETRQLREEIREALLNRATAQPSGSSTDRTATGVSAREQKMNGTTTRGQLREERVQAKARRQRVGQRNVPGDEADDESEDDDQEQSREEGEMDPKVKKEHLLRLKSRIRRAVDDVLQVVDWKTFHVQHPALTEEEITAYIARDPAIVPTVSKIRFDFSPEHGWKRFPHNQEARAAFINRYLSRVAGGAYFKNPTPRCLLTEQHIGKILDGQIKYLRDRWRKANKPLTPEQLKDTARRVAANSRKFTIFESREVTLVRRKFERHRALFRLLDAANMSGDETDGPEKTHPPRWRIIISLWQSRELRDFLWALDRMYREDWARRRTGGNPPRERVARECRTEDGRAPVGLWRNCYDKDWLERQPAYIIDELEIIDEDYDFSLV